MHVINSARESENQQREILLPTPNTFIEKINEDTPIMDKIIFVAFICKIVNVTLQEIGKVIVSRQLLRQL